MSYNAKIRREQGGSVITVAAGGSIKVEQGGTLGITGTTAATPYRALQLGNNALWYMAGSAGSPVFSASPGDMLLLSQSASTGLFLNVSDGTAGSRWVPAHLGGGSQLAS